LKLKKVNAFEASLSRQQQEATARQAEETSRQGQTLMTFTIVTIISASFDHSISANIANPD
jgi:hypothetical protein